MFRQNQAKILEAKKKLGLRMESKFRTALKAHKKKKGPDKTGMEELLRVASRVGTLAERLLSSPKISWKTSREYSWPNREEGD